MLLPGGAAFGPLARTVEFRTILAGTIEFRRARETGGRSDGRSPWGRSSRGREKRGRVVAAAILARFVVTGLVEISGAVAEGRELRPAWSGEEASRFCHGFESPRSGRSPKSLRGAAIRARSSLRSGAPRENFLSPPNFLLGPVAVARRPRGVRAVASRPVAVLAKTFAARRIGPLLAAAFTRRIGLPVAEFPVLETRGRAGIAAVAARGVGTLFAFAAGSSRSAETADRCGRRSSRLKRGAGAFALAGVGLAGARIGLLAVGFGAVGLAGIGTPLAIALSLLAGKAALGEFLLGSPGGAGAALAAGGPITPAAGIVVFVVVAGHEWSHFGCS